MSGRVHRRPRGSLSHDQILEAALELVEREGLERLTMSALARHLECGVASTYWYYRNKSVLVEALAERVTADVHARLPPLAADLPWDEAYRGRLVAFDRSSGEAGRSLSWPASCARRWARARW